MDKWNVMDDGNLIREEINELGVKHCIWSSLMLFESSLELVVYV